jgi:hypothetical protein
MRNLILILAVFSFSLPLFAGVSDEVFIRGKIGGDFDEKKVKVIDSFNQSYYLEKKYFPKDFNFKQGESFSIEVPEAALKDLKISKK